MGDCALLASKRKDSRSLTSAQSREENVYTTMENDRFDEVSCSSDAAGTEIDATRMLMHVNSAENCYNDGACNSRTKSDGGPIVEASVGPVCSEEIAGANLSTAGSKDTVVAKSSTADVCTVGSKETVAVKLSTLFSKETVDVLTIDSKESVVQSPAADFEETVAVKSSTFTDSLEETVAVKSSTFGTDNFEEIVAVKSSTFGTDSPEETVAVKSSTFGTHSPEETVAVKSSTFGTHSPEEIVAVKLSTFGMDSPEETVAMKSYIGTDSPEETVAVKSSTFGTDNPEETVAVKSSTFGTDSPEETVSLKSSTFCMNSPEEIVAVKSFTFGTDSPEETISLKSSTFGTNSSEETVDVRSSTVTSEEASYASAVESEEMSVVDKLHPVGSEETATANCSAVRCEETIVVKSFTSDIEETGAQKSSPLGSEENAGVSTVNADATTAVKCTVDTEETVAVDSSEIDIDETVSVSASRVSFEEKAGVLLVDAEEATEPVKLYVVGSEETVVANTSIVTTEESAAVKMSTFVDEETPSMLITTVAPFEKNDSANAAVINFDEISSSFSTGNEDVLGFVSANASVPFCEAVASANSYRFVDEVSASTSAIKESVLESGSGSAVSESGPVAVLESAFVTASVDAKPAENSVAAVVCYLISEAANAPASCRKEMESANAPLVCSENTVAAAIPDFIKASDAPAVSRIITEDEDVEMSADVAKGTTDASASVSTALCAESTNESASRFKLTEVEFEEVNETVKHLCEVVSIEMGTESGGTTCTGIDLPKLNGAAETSTTGTPKNTAVNVGLSENCDAETLHTDESKVGKLNEPDSDAADNTPILRIIIADVTGNVNHGGESVKTGTMETNEVKGNAEQTVNVASGAPAKNATKAAPPVADEDDVQIMEELCADSSHLCSTCGQIFATSRSLTLHLASKECVIEPLPDVEVVATGPPEPARPARKYRCDACGRLFAFLWGFDKHIGAHIRQLPSVKGMVQSAKNDASDPVIARELLGFSSKGEFMCKKCGRCFVSLDDMTIHARRHLPPDMLRATAPTLAFAAGHNGGRKKPYTWITQFPDMNGKDKSGYTYTATCSYCCKPIGSVQSLLSHVPQCTSMRHIKEMVLQQPEEPTSSEIYHSSARNVASPLPSLSYPFVCECRQKFRHLRLLQEHLQKHFENGEMTSVHAAVIMRQNQPLIKSSPADTTSTLKKPGVICSECNKIFSSVTILKKHKEKEHCSTRLTWSECCSTSLTFGGYYQCDECPAVVNGSESFRQHMAGHAEKKLNVFLRCKLQLAKALKNQTPVLPSPLRLIGQPGVALPVSPETATSKTCPYCGASFDSRTLCMLHVKRFCKKNPDVPVHVQSTAMVVESMPVENDVLIGENNLRRLAEEANGRASSEHDIFPCKYCDTVCTSLLSYSRHFERHMQVSKVPYLPATNIFGCLICYRHFATQAQYNDHMQTHSQPTANSVCTGCYRIFHPAYPLMHHKGSGQRFCTKCAAAFEKGSVITTAPMFRAANYVQNQMPITSNHNSAPTPWLTIPNNVATNLAVPSIPNPVLLNSQIERAFQNPSIRSTGITFRCKKKDFTGYESVLQKLGYIVHPVAAETASAAPSPAVNVMPVVDDSEGYSAQTFAAGDPTGDAPDEFMPTDFLSIEMPAADASEELVVDELETASSDQVTEEHAYSSKPPEVPFVIYRELAEEEEEEYLHFNSTPLLSQLLSNPSTAHPIASRTAQAYNGTLSSLQQMHVLTSKNAQPNYVPTWSLDWHPSLAQRQQPVQTSYKQRNYKRPSLSSGNSKLPAKRAKLPDKSSSSRPRSVASMFGLRECSVVLTRLNLMKWKKVRAQGRRHNASSKENFNGQSIASPKSNNQMVTLPKSNDRLITSLKSKLNKMMLTGQQNDGVEPFHHNGQNSSSGRESPDCVVVMEKFNGVVVTSPDASPLPKKRRISSPRSSISTFTDVHNKSDPKALKSVVLHDGQVVRLKPCKVVLHKLNAKTQPQRLQNYICGARIVRKVNSMVQSGNISSVTANTMPVATPIIDVDNDSASNCSSLNTNYKFRRHSSSERKATSASTISCTLRPCRVVVQRLEERCVREACARFDIREHHSKTLSIVNRNCDANEDSTKGDASVPHELDLLLAEAHNETQNLDIGHTIFSSSDVHPEVSAPDKNTLTGLLESSNVSSQRPQNNDCSLSATPPLSDPETLATHSASADSKSECVLAPTSELKVPVVSKVSVRIDSAVQPCVLSECMVIVQKLEDELITEKDIDL